MNQNDLVLIDTCIWIPYFNRPQSAEKRAVDALLDEDRAALISPVLAKVLQGFRRDDCAVYSTDPHFDLIPRLKRFISE